MPSVVPREERLAPLALGRPSLESPFFPGLGVQLMGPCRGKWRPCSQLGIPIVLPPLLSLGQSRWFLGWGEELSVTVAERPYPAAPRAHLIGWCCSACHPHLPVSGCASLTTPLTVPLRGGSTFCDISLSLFAHYHPFHRPRGPETQERMWTQRPRSRTARAAEGPASLSASPGEIWPPWGPPRPHTPLYLPAAWSCGPAEPPLPWTGSPLLWSTQHTAQPCVLVQTEALLSCLRQAGAGKGWAHTAAREPPWAPISSLQGGGWILLSVTDFFLNS